MKTRFFRLLCLILGFLCLWGWLVPPAANALSITVYHIYSLEEYEQTIAKYELPGNYVTYDMIKMAGEFYSFYLGTSKVPHAESVYFNLIDSKGFRYTLTSGFAPSYGFSNEKRPLVPNPADPHDLRISPSKSCHYQLGPLTYLYIGPGLSSIYWEHNGRKYTLSANVSAEEKFINYPTEEKGTFLDRMLDADTAQAAIRELMASVDAGQKPLRQAQFRRELSDWVMFFLTFCAIVGGGIFLRRWLTKKRLLREIEEEEFMAAHADPQQSGIPKRAKMRPCLTHQDLRNLEKLF